MKFGKCSELNECNILKKEGYDYIEIRISNTLVMDNDDEYAEIEKKIKDMPLPCYAACYFIPGSYSIITEYETGEIKVLDYVDKVLSRFSTLGGKVVVFGSGGSRMIPENMEYEKAWDNLKHFCIDSAKIAKKYGITIILEHLSRKGDIIGSAKTASKMVREVNDENFKMLVDTYHMVKTNEPAEIIEQFVDLVKHVHIEDAEDRSYPHKDMDFYKKLAKILKKAGYNEGVSMECLIKDPETDYKEGLKILKEVFL